MNKRNIGYILVWETWMIAMFSLSLGLVCGIAFSKLAELGLVNLMKENVNYAFSISPSSILLTICIYGIIFFLLLLNAIRQIRFTNAIQLLQSQNMSEKPPKANWLFGILGLIILGIAYYISLSIKNPLSALGSFFIAVILVIIGTYLFMIAGSVVLCRLLQKNKKFYYKKNHFVSVSSMAYRMKRNGAGLASICILATMVLVMISSTSSLFIGGENALINLYPRKINTSVYVTPDVDLSYENISAFKNTVQEDIKAYHGKLDNVVALHSATISGLLNDGDIIYDPDETNRADITNLSDIVQVYIIPLKDYNEMSNTNIKLENNEALLYTNRLEYTKNTIGFHNTKEYTIKEHLKDCFLSGAISMNVVSSFVLVVDDVNDISSQLTSKDGTLLATKKWTYCFDTNLDKDKEMELYNQISNDFTTIQENNNQPFNFIVESREANRTNFYSLFGGLFYLGILLSLVFIIAAVLIIYYKQISEGYEDQARFDIMQKVGMTKKDIRKSINSQLLMVFFLPLLGAGMHLAFAFPIIEKLLQLFNLFNRNLFIMTTAGSFVIFAIFYAIVYKLTSNAYYNIVSKAK